MVKKIFKLAIPVFLFLAFFMSGELANYLEHYHSSIVASSAVFGVSFVSIIGGATKIWYDIFC
jgi:hypothetical protein